MHNKMVVCNMDIPRPPPPPSLKFNHGPKLETGSSKKGSNSPGFRLLDNQDDTGSVYSVYKQKIDSMFESDSSSVTKNSVQARIEKMFSDVALDSVVPTGGISAHVFSVDYMGSVPLQQKVASLAGLQDPLKELYFTYKRNTHTKKPLTGRLEISSNGLKVQYQDEKGDIEQMNPFPTIAVWSAVKFVVHRGGKTSYAFLPLITDPDNVDKQTLFRTLKDNEHIATETHSPLFAVVMRKSGIQKNLDCHGFICQTSEDAIVIAATLYKTLMAHMKTKDKKPKMQYGVTCMSVTSSALNESLKLLPVRPPRKSKNSLSSDSEKETNTETQIPPAIPPTPKKSIKTKRAPRAPEPKLDLDAILPYDAVKKEIKPPVLTEKWSTMMSAQQKQITAEIKQMISDGSHRGLQNRKLGDELLNKLIPDVSGDILTKVTIPRSGSFLNAGGLTRYKSKISRANGQAIGGSPLGFHELFNEFRLQEGLHSVDEILGAIIDPEGMSFNDLKPIYKEFLLKLAMTLTKDELYQRSKAIMRRHKKKQIRRGGNILQKKKKLIVNRKFKTLKHIFRKTLKGKLGKALAGKTHGTKTTIHEGLLPKIPESSISTSSYDTRQFRPKPVISSHGPKRQSYRKRSKQLSRRERTSTSEESDFFSLRRESYNKKGNFQLVANQNRNSSSGYVSCSECSYDSDTCTCISADKCYCSLGQKSVTRRHAEECCSNSNFTGKCFCSWRNPRDSVSLCDCDTDSCTDSNKCYCQKGDGVTVLEQLRQRGFIPPPESVSVSRHKRLCKNYSNTKSSKSLEYMHNPTEEYYEKLREKQLEILARRKVQVEKGGRSFNTDNPAVGYELFTAENKRMHNCGNGGFYGKANSECGHQSMFKSSSSIINPFKYGGSKHEGKMLRSTSMSEDTCKDALSVKKSAEIAALFADIKLSQTTDITHMIPHGYDKSAYKNIKNRKDDDHQRLQDVNLVPNKSALHSSKNACKNKMYSAQNGLYTIQSQSDDSRRSSIRDQARQKENRIFFNPESAFDVQEGKTQSSIGDSLGYLP